MQKSVTETFKDYLSVSDLAGASIDLKSRAIKYFIGVVGDIDVANIKFCHAEDYKCWLPKGRSKASANIYLRNIKPFFKWLFNRRYIEQNPFLDLKFYKVGDVYREIYTPDEIERMMLCSSEYWQAIITLGLLSLRRSEILNLTIEDIYFDRNYILIREKKDTATTWSWQIKNHNQAIVPLPPKLELKSYSLDVHGLIWQLIEKVRGLQPYVFVKPKHYKNMLKMREAGKLTYVYKNLPYNNFSRDFRAIQRRAQVPVKRFHDLRATFATKMAEHGMSLIETQKLMRHSDPKTTAKYYIRLNQQKLIEKTVKYSSKFFKIA